MPGEDEALGATTPAQAADTADTEIDGAALAGTAPAALTPAMDQPIRVVLPEQIGRYVPSELLGSGGMGIVYRARDPELDRDVAVKLLRPGPLGRASGTEGRARLLREARAMARVRHPNVITVHDVGAVDDQLFVAMELIDGKHLGGWLEASTRSWQDVVETFVSAGRGLAAAHSAELVHRDFKPENVLIDREGGVLVTDFGLARDLGQDDAAAPVSASTSSSSDSLTRTGAIMGTPLYMSPEQHRGDTADARSDQFSFCVTFYAALYGQHPYPTKDASKLRRDVLAGDVRPPPATTEVPAWLLPLLVRGMRPDPADRHPSMDALLGAIEARIRPPRRRWPLVVGAAVVVAIAIAAGIFFARRGGDAPTASCDDARAKLARVWDDERKERVRATLSAGGTETHINTAARVVNILDEYTDRWVESYDGACRATHIDRTQPAEQLEIRTACYEGLRRKLAALTDILSEKDDVLVMSAVRVAAAMPAVDECEHATGNAIDPRAATPLVDEAIVLIERAKALSNVGRIEHAVESAVHAVAIARRTEHDPTLAEALLLLGALYMDIDGIGPSQRSLEEAVEVAERAGAHQIRANAATGLAYFHGVYVIRPQLAAKWTAIAEDALSKLPADNAEVETTRARLALSSAYTAVWNGDYEAAQALLQRAIDTFTGEHRNDLDGLMSVHAAAGEMAWELGMYRTASEHHEQCVQIAQTAYGADNPYTDVRRVELARMLAMSGELDRAAALVEPAHARLRAIYETHSEVAGAWLTLGIVRRLQKRFDEARDAIATAVEMSIDIHGAGSIPTADAFAALADVHLDAGQLDAAFEAADRAHAIRLAALGPEHLWVGESKLDLGMIALAKNELDRADELLGTALEISLEELGVDHYFIAIIRATRAQVQLARGERAAALEVMRAARAVIADSESPPEYLTKLDIVIASADPD